MGRERKVVGWKERRGWRVKRGKSGRDRCWEERNDREEKNWGSGEMKESGRK